MVIVRLRITRQTRFPISSPARAWRAAKTLRQYRRRILLEPANLGTDNTVELRRETYIQVARAIMRGEADVGFLPVEAFEALSSSSNAICGYSSPASCM